MRICGLKLTHDCSIAIIEDGNLICCHELEKIQNNARFSLPESFQTISRLVKTTGFSFDDFDSIVIDGWVGEEESEIVIGDYESRSTVKVCGYEELDLSEDIFNNYIQGTVAIENHHISYISFKHVLGHILSAYCTSPFAKSKEESFILVWDGGMCPRLYYITPVENKIVCLGELFYFGVNVYSIFAQHFRPFKINANVIKDELSIAGKVMAYTAYGNINEEIISNLEEAQQCCLVSGPIKKEIPTFPYAFARKFMQIAASSGYIDEDVIASFHEFLKRKLVTNLYRRIAESGFTSTNICLSGGAALNIKWNSAIRSVNSHMQVYACPFPNDSGSAIGAACAAFVQSGKEYSLNWNIYSGPAIHANGCEKGWMKRISNPKEIAQILHEANVPVLILMGNAELGPRALGNRSILAPPTSSTTKELLNAIKFRESYRPIAPVCLEEFSKSIFTPGGYDPFMLFDHRVNEEWIDKIPATVHYDGTARLQTVNERDNSMLYAILKEYYKLSGIPVLCNTSANFKGSGFFPDIRSAMIWNKVSYIFEGEMLYWRES